MVRQKSTDCHHANKECLPAALPHVVSNILLQVLANRLHSILALIISLITALTINTGLASAQYHLNLPEKTYPYFPVSAKNPVTLDYRRQSLSVHQLNVLATMGRVLFYDRNLSANRLVSCASCHNPKLGFDDRSQFSIGHKGVITKRNAMGLANLATAQHKSKFWDRRAPDLKTQTLLPFFDPIEMGMSVDLLLQRTRNEPAYRTLAKKAFENQNVGLDTIATALSAFLLSLYSNNARFDQAQEPNRSLTEDFPKFTAAQNRGKFLFFATIAQGGANCAACHQGKDFQIRAEGANNGLDESNNKDKGIGAISGKSDQEGLFSPPSLRNIGVRTPYMHDGRFETLTQVVNHYSNSVRANPNLSTLLKNKDGTPRRFNFPDSDVKALVDFLNTLTDETFLNAKQFSNPFTQAKH